MTSLSEVHGRSPWWCTAALTGALEDEDYGKTRPNLARSDSSLFVSDGGLGSSYKSDAQCVVAMHALSIGPAQDRVGSALKARTKKKISARCGQLVACSSGEGEFIFPPVSITELLKKSSFIGQRKYCENV